MADRRVVITGVGAVSPCGGDTESTWASVVAGKSGIANITLFDASAFACKFAGEVKGFNPEDWMERKKVKEVDRFIQFAMAASELAIRDSGFQPAEEMKERVGTFIGVGLCGLATIEQWAKVLNERGPNKISPYFIPGTIANLAPGQVSMRYGFRGPSYTNTSACASGNHAIGEAFHWIRRGGIDAAIAGGAEATVTGLGVGGFCALRALSTRNDAPQKASRPWDKDRDGFVIGEGAGVLMLEELESAKKRGAKILAEIVGYGATSDAYHLTQPAPNGEGAQRAMKHALADGGIDISRVDYVNAHGTSTPIGDVQEIRAIKAVLGERVNKGVSISSTKSMTGHLLGGAGGLEGVLTALAIAHKVAPPTINLDEPDDECVGLDLVPHQAKERAIDVAISNSFGFGGTNATIAFARFAG